MILLPPNNKQYYCVIGSIGRRNQSKIKGFSANVVQHINTSLVELCMLTQILEFLIKWGRIFRLAQYGLVPKMNDTGLYLSMV